MSVTTPDADTIRHACAQLRRHALVAFPTETVYGLGADARSPIAVRRIFATKGRPVDHPVIVHLHDSQQVSDWAEIPDTAMFRSVADRFWPGPLTVVLPRRATASAGVAVNSSRVPHTASSCHAMETFMPSDMPSAHMSTNILTFSECMDV